MDTGKLKKFAQEARTQLMAQVAAKLELVLAEGSAARREAPAAVKELFGEIARSDKQQVIEKVAYTWFNRFTALRFMDANGLTNPRVVTPAEGQTRPELLADAAAGHMDETVPEATRNAVAALLDGRTPSRDGQGEAYRLLLVAACNGWHAHMPFMFEKIRDYTELLMPEDLLSQDSILSRMRSVMADEDCQDVEIIGWLYQFYISEKKDQVFAALKKNVKISAENIPAATQLFTPHWIVRYLVENSLGRLWMLNRPQSKLATQMEYYIAPEEPETDFLRVAKPEDIRICDPACGSGHMLTYAFDLLHAIYEEEGYDAGEIPALILTRNLHGVEIDDRAGALASFALSMKAAAKLGRRRFLRLEVKPNICVLQDVRFTPSEMQDVMPVVGRDLFTADLRETLGQFEQAKNFGSLVVPKLADPAEVARLLRLKDFSSDLLLRDVQLRLLKVLEMSEFLAPRFHVAVTNPPYAATSGLNLKLQEFTKTTYPASKADLYASFMERMFGLLLPNGLAAIVNMQSWMFLGSYQSLRNWLWQNITILTMAHIGERGFDTIGGAVVSTTALVAKKAHSNNYAGVFFRLIAGRSEREKSDDLRSALSSQASTIRFLARTKDFVSIPGEPVAYWLSAKFRSVFQGAKKVADIADPRAGLQTSDNNRFLRLWHEVAGGRIGHGYASRSEAATSGKKWFPCTKGGGFRRWYGFNDYVVNWENDGSELFAFAAELYGSPTRIIKNANRYFEAGLTWSSIAPSFSMRYCPKGFIFETKGSMCFPHTEKSSLPLLALMNSKIVEAALRVFSPTLDFHEGPLGRVPALIDDVDESARRSITRAIEIAKLDWDSSETSWEFSELPLLSEVFRRATLQSTYEAVREHWQKITSELLDIEETNNRNFIAAYGLQDELSPEVPLEELSLNCNPAYRYGAKLTEQEQDRRFASDTVMEFLHYSVGCMFGRYSIDAPGLILANQGEGLADYLARVPDPRFDVDADNVIPVLEGEWFADDITERFRKFLRGTFGEEKFQENLAFIEEALGKDIRKWFTKDFFDYHVRRYKKRPIYWMFSSPKGTFNALIYVHRYRPDTVSVVLNDYLRELISKLQAERARLEKLADDASVSQAQRTRALKEIGTVVKQIDELTAWERDVIFPLAQAKIEIDLDDGVKANYPKFGAALKPIKGLDAKEDE